MKIYTSYLAKAKKITEHGILPVAIIRYLPKRVEMINITTLAPNADILKQYKADGLIEPYTNKFNDYLDTLDAHVILDELARISNANGHKDIALICYEKSGAFCHRHLIADWLNNSGILSTPITELDI